MTKQTTTVVALLMLANWTWAQYRQVSYESQINSVSPWTGIVFWTDNEDAQTFNGSYALEFAYCLPCDVVTGKSNGQIQYDWSRFEALLNGIQSRGHKAVIRFRYEYPGERTNGVRGATAVPQYIKELPDYHETYKSNPGGDGPTYYADWSNEELKWFTLQFYTDLAARYDHDPRLAFLQVGFGHWSEYHIYDGTDNPYQMGVNFPTKEYQRSFLQHIDTTFSVTPWSVSIDIAESDHTPGRETNIQDLSFGLFDDSFMHKKHELSSGDGYNEQNWIALDGISERWKRSPCGGEISYYADKDQKNFLKPGTGIYGISWEQASEKYHITYIIGNDCTEGQYGTASRVKEASLWAGYRFEMTAYGIAQDSAQIVMTNTGIAPCYYDIYPTLLGVRSEQSLKGVLPGDTIVCTIRNVHIADDNVPEIIITGDKLYPNETVPFEAHIEATETSLNPSIPPSAEVRKYIRNGLLFIERNGELFDLLGRPL